MKRLSLMGFLSAALFLFANKLPAQYYFYNDKYFESEWNFEIGASTHIMNALTDLGGKKGLGKPFIKDLNMKYATVGGGVFASALYKDIIAIRLEGTFGKVRGNDTILAGDNSEAKNRYYRNLSFRSKITEATIMAEIHPLMMKNYDIDEVIPRLSPYIVGGIGFFNFNPQANLNGVWVNLSPLRTEGQGFNEYPERKPYKLTQLNIPFGIGVKYELGALWNARFEVVNRFLFTDYLDDVSTTYIDPTLFYSYMPPTQAAAAAQLASRPLTGAPSNIAQPGAIRGDAKDKDSYFTINLKLSFNIGRAAR
jgi:hypothetical protein